MLAVCFQTIFPGTGLHVPPQRAFMRPPCILTVDPAVALEETLAREKTLKEQMLKAHSKLNSMQNLNAKLAEDLKANMAQVAALEKKGKEDALSMKSLQNQSSQSFKLAEQVRKSQDQIARLQQQLKGAGAGHSACVGSRPGCCPCGSCRRLCLSQIKMPCWQKRHRLPKTSHPYR